VLREAAGGAGREGGMRGREGGWGSAIEGLFGYVAAVKDAVTVTVKNVFSLSIECVLSRYLDM
jgi:hypothetical protein